MTTADINGDGRIDIIHPNCKNDQINILFNYGNGTFISSRNYSTGMGPSSVVVGDMNNDGKIDIIITNKYSDNVGIFYNIGNDTFTDQIIYPTSPRPLCAVLVDLNEDNYLDIIVTIQNTDKLDILLNTGNGTFTRMTHFIGLQPGIITTADIDNDNKLDIIVGDSKQVGKRYFCRIIYRTYNCLKISSKKLF